MTTGILQLKAMVVGIGLAAAATLSAQVPTPPIDATPTPAAATSTPRVTGSIVDLRNTSPTPTAETRNLFQFSRLLNANIQATDGPYGRVTDVVFDRNGNIQYLLASHQGQTFVLPYLASSFSTTGNVMTFNVPIAALQQLAINPQNLPPMESPEFLTRMRQVFGPTFGATQVLSANSPTPNQTGIGATPRDAGIAATPRPPGISAAPGVGNVNAAATPGSVTSTATPGPIGGAGTIGASAGAPQTGLTPNPLRTGASATIPRPTLGNNTWNWPTSTTANGRFVAPGAATGRTLGTGLPPRQTPATSGGGS